MPYRRLTIAELEHLRDDFVQFLAANSVESAEWERLKTADPEKAEGLIDIFSQLVFEQVVAKAQYLEFATPQDLKTFYCGQEKIFLRGLRMEGTSSLDLTSLSDSAELTTALQQPGVQAQLYSAEKAYRPNREEEIFRMLQSGAKISRSSGLFDLLGEAM